jgi:hypothetical protein
MTDITIEKEKLEIVLEALKSGDWYINQLELIVYSADDEGTHEERAKVQKAIKDLEAALGKKVNGVWAPFRIST